jgi:hypothetical protein
MAKGCGKRVVYQRQRRALRGFAFRGFEVHKVPVAC